MKNKMKRMILKLFIIAYTLTVIVPVYAEKPPSGSSIKLGPGTGLGYWNYDSNGRTRNKMSNGTTFSSGSNAIYVYLIKYHGDPKQKDKDVRIVGDAFLYYESGFFRTESALGVSAANAKAIGISLPGGLEGKSPSDISSSLGPGASGGGEESESHTTFAYPILEALHQKAATGKEISKETQGQIMHDSMEISGRDKATCIVDPMISSYGSEVINTYPEELYRLMFRGKELNKNRKQEVSSTVELSTESGVKSFINTSVVSQILGYSSDPITAFNKFFNTNEINKTNFEDYYLAVEYASRNVSTELASSSTYDSYGGEEVFGDKDLIAYNYSCICPSGYKGGRTCSSMGIDTNCCGGNTSVCSKKETESYSCNCKDANNKSCSEWESGCSCDSCDRTETHYSGFTSSSYQGCSGYYIRVVKHLITIENKYYSYITEAKGSKGLLSTKSTDEDTKHEIIKANTTNEYYTEYYVGPALESALVGMESTLNDKHSTIDKNTFLLYFADRNSQRNTKAISGKQSATDVYYRWMGDLINKRNCLSTCTKGDLKCAETFCDNYVGYDDRANTYQMKYNCIVNNCQFKKKEDNCNSMEHNKDYLDSLNNACTTNNMTTYCSKISDTSNNSGEGAKKDKPTTQWCYNDEETTPIDQRTFINVSCTENSYFTFSDISKVRLTSGTGIDYWTRLNGNKKCKVWFDLDSWQLAYASFHSRDKVCIDYDISTNRCLKEGKNSREYLEEILNRYNKASVSYDPIVEYNFKDPLMNTISTAIDSSEHATDVISWEQLNYTVDDARVQIKARVTEKINNKETSSKEYTLVSVEEPVVDTFVTYNDKDKQTGYYKYNRLNASEVYANSYTTSSNVKREYAFDKYCLSTDGKSTVSLSGGTCYKIQSNGINNDVTGQNTYYTTLRPINNTDTYQVSVNTVAVLSDDKNMPAGVSSKNSKLCKTEEKDSCNTKTGASCFITIEKNAGTVLDSKIYSGANGVNAVLNVMNNNETVKGYNIESRKNEAQVSVGENNSNKITVTPSASAGFEEIEISGIVKTDKGTTTCTKTIKADKCNNACTFTRIEDDKQGNIRYEVNIGAGGKVYAQSSKSTNKLEVSKNQSGKYIVGIKQNLIGLSGIKIYATNGNVCCSTKILPEINAGAGYGKYNCIEDINSDGTASRKEVKEYCDEYWSVDENDYESSLNCINSCWYNCPIIQECTPASRKVVEEFCEGKYGSDLTLYSQCVNRCYSSNNCSNDQAFVFRSISNVDPFPNSDQSPYNQGKRMVGANWVGFEHYIVDDKEDQSSVTGPSASQKPEYVIDLTPEDIRNIRDNTKTLMKEKKLDGYTEYEYTESVKKQKESGVDIVKEYESAFVHDNFRDLFTVTPNKGSDIGE